MSIIPANQLLQRYALIREEHRKDEMDFDKEASFAIIFGLRFPFWGVLYASYTIKSLTYP